jgi:deoxycytidine triphosphate deaminase
MFQSDRDLRWAIENGRLIVDPPPTKIDPTSIDLHLDSIDQAKIWNMDAVAAANKTLGLQKGELLLGTFDFRSYSDKHLQSLPDGPGDGDSHLVFQRGNQVIVRPFGFLLWQTKEEVGTPEDRADLICFVEGKSTRARTGILVHMTAPTIHSTWVGHITLEIANLGPFTFVLQAGDVIAQLTVASISSSPVERMKTGVTFRQKNVAASPGPPPK